MSVREQPDLGSGVTFAGSTFAVAEGKARVAVRLRNSGKVPLFVISHVRRLTLDDGGTTLTLWLTERGAPQPAQPMRHLAAPVVMAFQPGEERTIEAALPEKMTRLLSVGRKGEIDFDVLDLTTTERVALKISVAETPFYFNPTRGNLLGQIQAWGQDVETAAERTGSHKPDQPHNSKGEREPPADRPVKSRGKRKR